MIDLEYLRYLRDKADNNYSFDNDEYDISPLINELIDIIKNLDERIQSLEQRDK